jgi:hypothetical protein
MTAAKARFYLKTAKKFDFSTGKYVPALAYTIHQNNPTAELKVNLHGKNMYDLLLR